MPAAAGGGDADGSGPASSIELQPTKPSASHASSERVEERLMA